MLLPIRNLLNRICHSIVSKSVSDAKYINPHEMIESMLIITTVTQSKLFYLSQNILGHNLRVNFRPSWSRIIADKKPPSGQTSVFIDAEKYVTRLSKLCS